MSNFDKHLLTFDQTVKEALNRLNTLEDQLTLFIVDNQNRLVGTLTDGDIRRSLVNGYTVDSSIKEIMFKEFTFLPEKKFTIGQVLNIKKKKIGLVPIVDDDLIIKKVINFDKIKSLLPVDAVIMAGGEGRRLRPLTETIPKPLLKIADKPIIEYNIDRLAQYGIQQMYISIKYLGHLIEEYFNDGSSRDISINYLSEDKPLGTIGALSLVDHFENDYIIVMNSDLLTNIDYEDFFMEFINQGADMAVATIPYKVDIPYAVVETNNNLVINFKEKPTYTYYSNAGIYLIKKEIIEFIPKDEFYNATDLMDKLIKSHKKLISYPMLNYWLDIGKPEDFKKAQLDIRHINF